MDVKLETRALRTMAAFERLTKVNPRDCIITEECVYFLVEHDKVARVIGKNGFVIKDVRRVLNKPVKVFGYYRELESQIRSMIPKINSMDLGPEEVKISINPSERSSVIGRNGNNIKVIREILKRHFSIKNVKIRM